MKIIVDSIMFLPRMIVVLAAIVLFGLIKSTGIERWIGINDAQKTTPKSRMDSLPIYAHQANAIFATDDEGVIRDQRSLIHWQVSTIVRSMVLRGNRDGHCVEVMIDQYVALSVNVAQDIRERSGGNRKTVMPGDIDLMVESTFRWCAEHVGILESV